MNMLRKLILGGVALGSLALATPAQAHSHHYYGHSHYYGGPRVYGGFYGGPYYNPYPYGYYQSYPYYGYSYGPGVTFAFGGHRYWRGHAHHHHH